MSPENPAEMMGSPQPLVAHSLTVHTAWLWSCLTEPPPHSQWVLVLRIPPPACLPTQALVRPPSVLPLWQTYMETRLSSSWELPPRNVPFLPTIGHSTH